VNCEHSTVLHGYLDGELDAARSAEFERHLESCAECLAALEAQESLRSLLQRSHLRERAPNSLRETMERRFDVKTPAKFPQVTSARLWNWLAIAAVLLAAVFGFRYFSSSLSGREDSTLAAQIVDAHLRSLQPGHLVDVVSSDQHTVKPWFDGKLEFAPPVRDFAEEGFPLQGGRLDALQGRTVAAIIYGRRKHEVNLFIYPSARADAAPLSGEQLGYKWIHWKKAGMEFWLISDTTADDLLQLQQLLAK
jgi:mycothiol system anti-sigma-R factor